MNVNDFENCCAGNQKINTGGRGGGGGGINAAIVHARPTYYTATSQEHLPGTDPIAAPR